MDGAYVDKLDGKIDEDFWERKMIEWRTDKQQVKTAMNGLASPQSIDRDLDAQRVFELANKAYLLCVSQDSGEKAKLLRMLCSNFSVDTVSIGPTYRYIFDIIANKCQKWKMVGTTRFELATSPTPRVRSTRLSHVPTCYDCRSHLAGPATGVPSVYMNGGGGQKPVLKTAALRVEPLPTPSGRGLRIPWEVRRRCRRRTRSSARRGTPGLRGSRAGGGTR